MKKFGRNLAIVAGTVAMAGVAAPLLIPIRPLEGTVPPEELGDPDSRFHDVQGIRIHCKFRGAGAPAFVLLHGHYSSLRTWNGVLAALSAKGVVLAYDRPGAGLSARPSPGEWKGPGPYDWKTQAAALPRLLDQFGIDKAILVGSSTGAAVALLAADQNPDRVERLVLVAPPIGERGFSRWKKFLMATPQVKRLGPVLLRAKVEEGMRAYLEQAWHDPSGITKEKWEECRQLFRVNDWDRGLWESMRAVQPFESICRPEDVKVPVLVVAGDDDRIARTSDVVRYAARIAHAQLALLPGCGHIPQEEAPGALLQALDEFLAMHLPA